MRTMKDNLQRLAGIVCALALFLAVAPDASALDSREDPGPDGWAGVRFGTPEEVLLEQFPDAEQIRDSGHVEGSQVPRLQDYRVRAKEVLGIAPCDVTFRLAGDMVYNISFDCRASETPAGPILEQHFGEAGFSLGNVSYWAGKTSGVSMRDGLNVFGFYSNGLNEMVQQKLQAELIRQSAIGAAQKAQSQ